MIHIWRVYLYNLIIIVWDDRSLTQPIQIIKEHGAGVCSMQSHPHLYIY